MGESNIQSQERCALISFRDRLLAGGAAAVHGQSALDGFDPNANGPIYVIVVQPDGKILIGGDFTSLSRQRRSGSHAQPDCPAKPGRHARPRLQPEREQSGQLNRGAGGRQDFGGRPFHDHRRTDAQLYRPARCHDRPGRFVRPEPEFELRD